MNEVVEKLKELGMKESAKKLDQNLFIQTRSVNAYAQYKYLTRKDIINFKYALNHDHRMYEYGSVKVLKIVRLEDYKGIPPASVVDNILKAKKTGYFDKFQVAYIKKNKVKIPDPIVFGRIRGNSDYFFIDQWDDDVSFDDIVRARK